eukprot:Opistho-2@28983
MSRVRVQTGHDAPINPTATLEAQHRGRHDDNPRAAINSAMAGRFMPLPQSIASGPASRKGSLCRALTHLSALALEATHALLSPLRAHFQVLAVKMNAKS